MKMSKKELITELKSIYDYMSQDIESYAYSFGYVRSKIETLLEKVEDLGKSEGRQDGIAKARTARTQKTKEKVQNAINLLRIEGKEITPYQIAKVANISYNTAKKYLDTIEAPAV